MIVIAIIFALLTVAFCNGFFMHGD